MRQKEDPASDYKKMKQNVMDEVKQIFRPEFLNRIDEIIVFHSLGKEEMKKIVSLLCNQFTKRLESQMNIHLKLRESAKALIVEKGTDASTEQDHCAVHCRQNWRISWQMRS